METSAPDNSKELQKNVIPESPQNNIPKAKRLLYESISNGDKNANAGDFADSMTDLNNCTSSLNGKLSSSMKQIKNGSYNASHRLDESGKGSILFLDKRFRTMFIILAAIILSYKLITLSSEYFLLQVFKLFSFFLRHQFRIQSN